MENLFFLLVLAIIVISNIMNVRKKMRSAKPSRPAEPARPGGWRKALRDAVAEIKAEMEQASGESTRARRAPSGWDDLLVGRRPKPQEDTAGRPQPEPEPARTRMEEKPPARLETRPASRIERMETPRVDRGRESLIDARRRRGETPEARMADAERRSDAGPQRQEVPAPGLRQRGPGRAHSVSELRNAVIWHEILGPPVALRDNGQGVWF